MKKVSNLFWLLSLLPLTCIGLVSLTPTAVQAQAEVRTKIRLTGAAINRIVPEGSAEIRTRGVRRSFQAEANRVNLADGTVLSVRVNGQSVGTMILTAGRGALELTTERKQTVPAIQKGDVVTLTTAQGTTILSGAF
jgi:hypothetical protein